MYDYDSDLMPTGDEVESMPHSVRMGLLSITVRDRLYAVENPRYDENGNDLNEGGGFIKDPQYDKARRWAARVRY